MADDQPRTVEQVQAEIDYLGDELETIHTRAVDDDGQARSLTEDEQTAWDDGTTAVDSLRSELADLERRRELAALSAIRGEHDRGAETPQFPRSGETLARDRGRSDDVLNDLERSLSTGDAGPIRDSVRHLLDQQWPGDEPGRAQAERMLNGVGIADHTGNASRGARYAAQHMAVYGNDHYRSAFGKIIAASQRGGPVAFTNDEARAWALADRFRDFNVTTGGDGGIQVPTHLNPAIRLYDKDFQDGIVSISRQEVLASPGDNTWNGVASAGVTVTYEPESDELVDAAPTDLNAISVPTHKATIYVEATIEYDQDVGMAGQLNMLFDEAMARNAASVFVTGTGTGQPQGIVTGLDALTNSEVDTDTTLVIDADDVRDLLFTELPAGFRGVSTWLMNDAIRAHIHSFADASGTRGLFTSDFTQGLSERLLGRPVVSASAMDNDPTPAVGDNPIVVGDFQQYIIVSKMDARLEYIANVMGANQRPVGRRGWVLYARHGGGIGSTNNTAAGPGNAFRLLKGSA